MKQLKFFSVLLLLLFSAGAKAQFAWYGSEGVAQVKTNLAEGSGVDQGVWMVATDEEDGGLSKVVWDDETINTSPDDILVKTYGGISGTAELIKGTSFLDPHVSVSFFVAGVEDSNPVLADASDWGGIAISYSCDVDARLELSFGQSVDASLTNDQPSFILPAAADGNYVRIPWSSFKQGGWGKGSIVVDEAVKQLAAIRFKIQSRNGNYHFKISAIGSYDMPENLILPTQCELKITATGKGSAQFGSATIYNNTSKFVVFKGTYPNITFSPDAGYKIKSVKVDAKDVTSSVVSNSYTVSDIQTNTTVAVEFEAIPTYQLTISATGNGSAKYDETTISNSSKLFTVIEGTNATITFKPDAGYMIKSVKLGSFDVTSSVTDNTCTLSDIQGNATIRVEFGAIPTCLLTISASGNGSATFNATEVRNTSTNFYVDKGTNPLITFSPDAEYKIKSVKVGTTDVTSSVVSNSYTISNIQTNTTVVVEFEEIPKEKCAKPTITFADGKLSFDCETEDAQLVYEITNADVKTGTAIHEVKLGGSEKVSVFKVSVYAKKAGFLDSEVVTKEIKVSFVDGDVNKDGKADVADHVTLSNIIMSK